MKFYYLKLINILTIAEVKLNKNDEMKETWKEELNFIHELKSFLFKEQETFYEIKGIDKF